MLDRDVATNWALVGLVAMITFSPTVAGLSMRAALVVWLVWINPANEGWVTEFVLNWHF